MSDANRSTAQPDLPVRLTEWTTCGGCAAKLGAAPLAELLQALAGSPDADLLVGISPPDDAAVYRISDEVALVSTTDFFPPLVDDPDDFGAIAAANACSDIFAMGARVTMALNIAAFPERLPAAVVEQILTSAAETVRAAGGVVAGGHTIRSQEPIFGLAVQGLVHPDRILTKSGAQVCDVLVLSKPIGTGIVLAGASDQHKRAAIARMRVLNKSASEALVALEGAVHAVTDITGFGLAGHGWEMAERSGVTLRFEVGRIPFYDGALAAAQAGVRTGGDARNREHLAGHVKSTVAEPFDVLAHDPQTSGGLLAAVAPGAAAGLISAGFARVGDVAEGPPGVVLR